MLMNSRGGPAFWGCMLIDSRGQTPHLERRSLGTISMDLAVRHFKGKINRRLTGFCAVTFKSHSHFQHMSSMLRQRAKDMSAFNC